MTIYNFNIKEFDNNYLELFKLIWDKKGKSNYGQAELLLVSRLNGKVNVSRLAEEINKYQWNFLRIWISFYSEKSGGWNIFEIKSYNKSPSLGSFYIGLTELPY